MKCIGKTSFTVSRASHVLACAIENINDWTQFHYSQSPYDMIQMSDDSSIWLFLTLLDAHNVEFMSWVCHCLFAFFYRELQWFKQYFFQNQLPSISVFVNTLAIVRYWNCIGYLSIFSLFSPHNWQKKLTLYCRCWFFFPMTQWYVEFVVLSDCVRSTWSTRLSRR